MQSVLLGLLVGGRLLHSRSLFNLVVGIHLEDLDLLEQLLHLGFRPTEESSYLYAAANHREGGLLGDLAILRYPGQISITVQREEEDLLRIIFYNCS